MGLIVSLVVVEKENACVMKTQYFHNIFLGFGDLGHFYMILNNFQLIIEFRLIWSRILMIYLMEH